MKKEPQKPTHDAVTMVTYGVASVLLAGATCKSKEMAKDASNTPQAQVRVENPPVRNWKDFVGASDPMSPINQR